VANTNTAAPDGLVYIVDDDEAIRDSLAFLLEGTGITVRTCATADEFLARYRAETPACVVLDIRMPGMSGMELQDTLIERGIRVPLIFITGHGDVPMAVAAVKKGAVDFIEKPFNDRDLLALIDRALRQQEALLETTQQRAAARALMAALTPREREVMEMVVAGKLNKTIADQLGISIKTVEAHRAKVMEKTQAKSLADLIQMTLGNR
jgi:RNA polymerase sigma factor (sigma-70 family)